MFSLVAGAFIYIKRWKKHHDMSKDDENYDTLTKMNAKQNFYSANSSKGSVDTALNNKMYNGGTHNHNHNGSLSHTTLPKDPGKMTVAEAATIAMARRNSRSNLRTNLSINDL